MWFIQNNYKAVLQIMNVWTFLMKEEISQSSLSQVNHQKNWHTLSRWVYMILKSALVVTFVSFAKAGCTMVSIVLSRSAWPGIHYVCSFHTFHASSIEDSLVVQNWKKSNQRFCPWFCLSSCTVKKFNHSPFVDVKHVSSVGLQSFKVPWSWTFLQSCLGDSGVGQLYW